MYYWLTQVYNQLISQLEVATQVWCPTLCVLLIWSKIYPSTMPRS